jgi:uncharacterized alkaline shock family protein YloU
MRFLEKLALFIFSLIILVVAVLSCLVIFQVVELTDITNFISENLQNEIVSRTVLVVSGICILLALKSLLFPVRSKKREEIKSGVLLENQDGRLLISKDTIENLVNSVVHSFPDALDAQTKILLDVDNNITVFVSLLVREEAIIKQLSAGIQNKIKETVKRNTDLDVRQVNINVKNIENEKNKKETPKKENSVAKIKMENVQFEDVNTQSNETQEIQEEIPQFEQQTIENIEQPVTQNNTDNN